VRIAPKAFKRTKEHIRKFGRIEAIGDIPSAKALQRRCRVMSTKRRKVLSPAARCPGLTSDLTDLVHKLIKDLFDPYRPELHYMRGSRPKMATETDAQRGVRELDREANINRQELHL
jgi:hypothetical protein